MRWIGTVKQLQIQSERLKDQQSDIYEPRRIMKVKSLELTADGAYGVLESGNRLQDVHHNLHPTSHSRGDNTLSICFTSQYQRARNQFGSSLPDGFMGENILVESSDEFKPGLPGRAIIFITDDTAQNIVISLTRSAPPCRPFSTFASGASNREELKFALQFLSEGGRGYYAQLREPKSALINIGADVYII